MTVPERDTNPSQVSSQQMLVVIYRPLKDESLTQLWWKYADFTDSYLATAGDATRALWVEVRDLVCAAGKTSVFQP